MEREWVEDRKQRSVRRNRSAVSARSFDGSLISVEARMDMTVRRTLRKVFGLTAVLLVALNAQAVGVKDTAPDFTLKSLEGSNLRLEEYRGQVVLINFWASWCGPCRQEMPLLDRLHHRYEDTGFAVLGVNVEGEVEPAQEIVDKTNVTFPILIDESQKVSEMYNLQAMPSTVVVDRDGVVRYIHLGYKPGDEAKYVEVVKKLIRE
jgi:peroxiredoxin